MKIFNILLLAVTILLVSCGSDPLSENIIGTWELVSLEVNGCDDPEENITLTEVDENNCIGPANEDPSCNVHYVFNADGTAVLKLTEDGELDTTNFSYTVNDDAETVELCDPDGTDCTIINVEGDILTQMITDDGCVATIIYEKS